MKQEEIILPQDITNTLLSILATDEKANLLLKGFLSGKEIKGKAALVGDFKILVDRDELNTV